MPCICRSPVVQTYSPNAFITYLAGSEATFKTELFLMKADSGTHTRTAVWSFGYICSLCGSSQGIKFSISLNVYHVLVLITFVLLFKRICMCVGGGYGCVFVCVCVCLHICMCVLSCVTIYTRFRSFRGWIISHFLTYSFISKHLAWLHGLAFGLSCCIRHRHADISLRYWFHFPRIYNLAFQIRE